MTAARTLYITNGDTAAEKLPALDGLVDVVPWRDALHVGPVPADLSLQQLSEARARFLAALGWGSVSGLQREFQQRDATLARATHYDQIVLWFEHDLYDQLQLVQILDWFANQVGVPDLRLICIGEFPGVSRFVGIGQLTKEQIASLLASAQVVTRGQLEAARTVWQAFRSADPTQLFDLLSLDTSALPYLRDAIVRLFEEYPSTGNGLSRTEQQILAELSRGPASPRELFRQVQEREGRPFLGDTVFFACLAGLASSAASLIDGWDEDGQSAVGSFEPRQVETMSRLALTREGRSVFEGRKDRITLHGIDRWHGGVHLQGLDPPWRWDRRALRLVRSPY